MPDTSPGKKPARPKGPNLLALLQPYRGLVALLAGLTIVGNALNLAVPKIVSRAIDAYSQGQLVLRPVVIELSAVAVGIFVFLYLQNLAQTLASERVARDLRTRLVDKISRQDHAYIQQVTPAKLLTNLTSDVDAIKMFISQAIASLISSVFLIIGASVLLLSINWKLGLAVLSVLPIIGVTFSVVLGQGSEAVQQGSGGDRLAEQSHQRKHPGIGAHPTGEFPASTSTRSSWRRTARRGTSASAS